MASFSKFIDGEGNEYDVKDAIAQADAALALENATEAINTVDTIKASHYINSFNGLNNVVSDMIASGVKVATVYFEHGLVENTDGFKFPKGPATISVTPEPGKGEPISTALLTGHGYSARLSHGVWICTHHEVEEINLNWTSETGFNIDFDDMSSPTLDSSDTFMVYGGDELIIDVGSSIPEAIYMFNRQKHSVIFSKTGSTAPRIIRVKDTIGLCRMAVSTGYATSSIHVYRVKTGINPPVLRHLDLGARVLAGTPAVDYRRRWLTFGDSIQVGVVPGAAELADPIPAYYMSSFGYDTTDGDHSVSGSLYSDVSGLPRILTALQSTDIKLPWGDDGNGHGAGGVLFIAAGINDFARKVAPDVFKEAVVETFEYIVNHSSGTVIIQSPLNYNSEVWNDHTVNLNSYRNILEELCAHYGFIYVDGGSFNFCGNNVCGGMDVWADGIHLKQSAYAAYCAELADKLSIINGDNIEGIANVTYNGAKVYGGKTMYRYHISGNNATTGQATKVATLPIKPAHLINVRGCVWDGTYALQVAGFSGAANMPMCYIGHTTGDVMLQTPYPNYDLELELTMEELTWRPQS